jgi:alpha-glucoside transport system permease protein
MDRLLLALVVVIGVPAVTVLYAYLIELLLSRMSAEWNRKLRPWFWLAPALGLLVFFLIYPTVITIWLSLQNANSTQFVGLQNFIYSFTTPVMQVALRNNLIWLILYPLVTMFLALTIAVLADRVRYESLVKAVVFIPMAISYVAAGVIWRLMYDYQPPIRPQTGVINAFLTWLLPNFDPQAWLLNMSVNNIALIAIGIWMYTGFATVILPRG